MKKLLPLIAVIFVLVFIGNFLNNGSEENDEGNYTVIDSSDEDNYYNESDAEDSSVAAFILTDKAESIDEAIANSQDEASKVSAKDLPQTELEAKERLEKAKAEALTEYEKAIAEAESEYETALTNLGIEIPKTLETETEESTEKDISDEVKDTAGDDNKADADVKEDKAEEKEETNPEEDSREKQPVESDNDSKPETEPTKEQIKEQAKADDSMKIPADEKPESDEITEVITEETADVSEDEEADGNVWIPESGKKYHKKKDCSNMKNPSKVTKEYAVSVGYTPCKRCYKNQ